MAQFGRPSTDTTNVGWEEDDGTTVNIFDQIDEAVRDDADFIRSALAPSADPYVTKITVLEDPVSSTGHIVRYVHAKNAAGGAQIDITVQLRQGYVNEGTPGTLIAEWVHTNDDETLTAEAQTLAGAEADAITDYEDLYIRIVANQV